MKCSIAKNIFGNNVLNLTPETEEDNNLLYYFREHKNNGGEFTIGFLVETVNGLNPKISASVVPLG